MRWLRAEALKLVTLPVVWLVVAAAVGLAAGLAWAVERSYPQPGGADLLTMTLRTAQAGPVVVGAVLAGHEHQGRQLRTTAVAAPQRGRWMLARWVTYLIWLLLVSALALGAAAAVLGLPGSELARRGWSLAYLVAVGLLGGLLADLARAAVVGAGGLLGLVWLAPVVLRWLGPGLRRLLPDEAGENLLAGRWAEHPAPLAWWLVAVLAGAWWCWWREA